MDEHQVVSLPSRFWNRLSGTRRTTPIFSSPQRCPARTSAAEIDEAKLIERIAAQFKATNEHSGVPLTDIFGNKTKVPGSRQACVGMSLMCDLGYVSMRSQSSIRART